MKKRLILCASVFLLAGCATPYVSKSLNAPPIKHCFDTVGHKEGSAPFILGGTCVCTPSKEVLGDYKANGFVADDMTLDELIENYRDKGIITAIEIEHTNNIDQGQKHVVFGGKSMVPPTPGTQNYEDVLFGRETRWKVSGSQLRRISDVKEK